MREHWQPTIFGRLEYGSQVRDSMAAQARVAWPAAEPSLLLLPPSRRGLLAQLPRPLRLAFATLSGTISLALAACSPTAAPTPINPEKTKPTPSPTREVPKLAVTPTPTPKLKFLPIKTENLAKPPGGAAIEEGWKWIMVKVILENTSKGEFYTLPSWRGIKITTAEGFAYEATGCYLQKELSLPPTFRVRGQIFPYSWERRPFEICSKVPNVSTDYTLEYPDASKTKVTRGFVDPDKLRYPTDHPDLDFSKVGTTFNIPNKGEITIVDLSKDAFRTSEWKRHGGSSSDIVYKLTARFFNASKGQNNNFLITLGEVFGTDGFIYHPPWTDYRSSDANAGRLRGTVGPNLTKDFEIYLALPGQFPGGKLPVGGDIKTIFNFSAK